MNGIRVWATLFVIGNLGGVIPLIGQDGVYKPNQLAEWLIAISSNPSSHVLSSMLFLLGTLSGVILATKLWKVHSWAALALGLGSLWNAFFIPTPLILAEMSIQGMPIDGHAPLLFLSLFADAMYNAALAISMVLISKSLYDSRRKLAIFGFIVAVPTLLVSGQFHFQWSAQLLGIAGPGWLTWWMIYGWTTDEQKTTVVQ